MFGVPYVYTQSRILKVSFYVIYPWLYKKHCKDGINKNSTHEKMFGLKLYYVLYLVFMVFWPYEENDINSRIVLGF